MTEAWRKAWMDGFAPLLPAAGLEALKKALEEDDPALIQGATTSPPPLACVQDWAVEGACVIGYCLWKGGGDCLVGTVEEAFAQVCFEADRKLDELSATRFFLNWADETPRSRMRRLLLPEVVRELERRRRETASA